MAEGDRGEHMDRRVLFQEAQKGTDNSNRYPLLRRFVLSLSPSVSLARSISRLFKNLAETILLVETRMLNQSSFANLLFSSNRYSSTL